MASHLLIGHHGVGLQWSWVSAEQTSSWPIMFTEDSPIDVVKAITWDKTVPAGSTGETLEEKKHNLVNFGGKLPSYYQDRHTDSKINDLVMSLLVYYINYTIT